MIHIHTDGACKGNPGPGGWGVLIKRGDTERRLCGGDWYTTNSQMELTAAIKALEALKRPGLDVTIYTDSQYVQRGITEWIEGWKANGWRNASKKPVANASLWQRLDELQALHRVTWQWVKGHAGNEGNEIADQLANKGCSQFSKA